MIQSSSCPQWQLDRPGPAGDHDGLAVVTPLTGTRSDGNLKEAVEKAATEDHRSLILWLNSFSLATFAGGAL
jgi:hypothetical protein